MFDPNDPTHMGFIIAASNLRAYNYGITGSRDPAAFFGPLSQVVVAQWQPKSVKIAANDEEAKKMEEEKKRKQEE